MQHLTKALELLKTLPDTPERAQQELTLQTALGAPLIVIKGYSSSEVGQVYSRARQAQWLQLKRVFLFQWSAPAMRALSGGALFMMPLLYATAIAAECRDRPEWIRYFTDAGTPGTFVLYDLQHDRFFALNTDITSKEQLGARIAIAKAILRAEGILPQIS
jgi:hypothetical protein